MSLFFVGNIWQSHKSYPGSASKNCGTKEILGEGIDGNVGRRIRKYFKEWREEKASVAEREQSEKAE